MIRVKLLTQTAKMPERGTPASAGLDLFFDAANMDEPGIDQPGNASILHPKQRKVFTTGISMAVPLGYYGQIAPRSGLAVRKGIEVLAGVIDADYRGEIKVILLNSGKHSALFEHGDKIAQMLILPCLMSTPRLVTELDDTVRGDGRFGSTGA